MHRTFIHAAALSLLLFALPAVAQSIRTVAGTYAPVAIPVFGEKPRGQMILGADGRYSIVLAKAQMPKIAKNARDKGTNDENRAVVDGTIAHWGRYSIDDGGKSITFHIEGSTFPNWDGTTQKRTLKIQNNTLSYIVAVPSVGSSPVENVWKRVK